MLIEAIRTLYSYNQLATERVLGVAEQLTADQWLAPQTAGRGSMRDTLVHLVSAQRGWLSAWGGALPPQEAARAQVTPADFPDVAAVRSFFRTVDGATQAFLKDLTDARLEEVVTRRRTAGGESRYPLWQMTLHVANHGTQHRSEVAAMLTAFGHSPGDLDLLRFVPSAEPGRSNP